MVLKEILDDPIGSKVVSCVIGLGFAIMFQKVCNGDSCIVVEGPNPKEVQKYYYKTEEQCYKYKPYSVHCEENQS